MSRRKTQRPSKFVRWSRLLDDPPRISLVNIIRNMLLLEKSVDCTAQPLLHTPQQKAYPESFLGPFSSFGGDFLCH